MSFDWIRTKVALDELFELLACGKCKATPDKPVRFITCGHFFCDTCIDNVSACIKCNVPVERKDMQPHRMAAQLVHYSKIIMNMISEINNEDLKPLNKMNDIFSAKQNAKVDESASDSDEVVEPTQIRRYKKEKNTEPENLKSVDTREIDPYLEKKDLQAENGGFKNITQILRHDEEEDIEPETIGYVDPTQIQQRDRAKKLEPQIGGFENPTQIINCGKGKEIQPEIAGIENSTLIIQRGERKDSETETVGFENSRKISHSGKLGRRGKVSETETVGFENSRKIQYSDMPHESEPETSEYGSSRQINQSSRGKDSGHEIHGFRNLTQIIRHSEEKDLVPESCGYVDATPVKKRIREVGFDAEPVSMVTHASMDESAMDDFVVPESEDESEMEQNSCAGTVIPETVPTTDDFYDARTITEATDSAMDIMASVEKEPVKKIEQTNLKLKRRSESPIRDYDTVTVTNVNNLDSETLELLKNDSLTEVRCVKNLKLDRQRKIPIHDRLDSEITESVQKEPKKVERASLKRPNDKDKSPKNDYDTLTIRNAASIEAESLGLEGKDPLKEFRRIKDLMFERQNKSPINDDDDDDDDEEEEDALKEFRRIKDLMFDRQSKIPINDDDDTLVIADGEKLDSESLFSVEKEASKEFENENLQTQRRNETSVNDDHDTLSLTTAGNFDTESIGLLEKGPIEKSKYMTSPKLDRREKNSVNDRDTLSLVNVENFDTETMGLVEKDPLEEFRRIKNLMFERYSQIVMDDDDVDDDMFTNEDLNVEIKKCTKESAKRYERVNLKIKNQGETSTSHHDVLTVANEETPEFEDSLDNIRMYDHNTRSICNVTDSARKVSEMKEKTPVKHLRSVENLKTEREMKIPVKKQKKK